jgi:phage terminase small subunit
MAGNRQLSMTAMNPKQRKFMEHYRDTPKGEKNAHKSALHAGYAPKSARQVGSRLLAHTGVRSALIEADASVREKRAAIDDNWLLVEAVQLWETPLRKLFDPKTGAMKPIHELDDDVAKLLGGFKVRQTFEDNEDGETLNRVELIDIKLIDRISVLKMIGTHTKVNAFGDKERADAAGSFSELLQALTKSAQGGAIDVDAITKMIGDEE